MLSTLSDSSHPVHAYMYIYSQESNFINICPPMLILRDFYIGTGKNLYILDTGILQVIEYVYAAHFLSKFSVSADQESSFQREITYRTQWEESFCIHKLPKASERSHRTYS